MCMRKEKSIKSALMPFMIAIAIASEKECGKRL